MAKKPIIQKTVETLIHEEAKRKNIPTAEHQSVVGNENKSPLRVKYQRNVDLDPQLVWRGKDEQDWSDLIVPAPPLYIQEKVHPKALIDDLLRRSKEADHDSGLITADLFDDFDGIAKGVDKTEFYSHDQNWSNRMILGDSLQVMASLAEREGLRGKVQCIYFDPPYGIKFNSNFQWSTTSRDVKDGKSDHITREPEQVKAFRDTWRDGINSYLTYLRDRLTVARDLLTESGSIFIQIGDENVHRVRALLDEVFGDTNFISLITVKKSGGMSQDVINNISDYIIWFAKDKDKLKSRPLFIEKSLSEGSGARYNQLQAEDGKVRPLNQKEKFDPREIPKGGRVYLGGPLTSQTPSNTTVYDLEFMGKKYNPKNRGWSTNIDGMSTLIKSGRIIKTQNFLNYKIYFDDFPVTNLSNLWTDTMGTAEQDKVYVVQTTKKVIQRCILMASDPGDLVLDPTCGSGTTATVCEQWGRRWITIDTSRVALALARSRIMGATFPYYLLADSRDGQLKEAEITRSSPSSKSVMGDIRYGLVYDRVPHITLKSIANNSEIGVIWEKYQNQIQTLFLKMNAILGKNLKEWELPVDADQSWSDDLKKIHAQLTVYRHDRQKEIDKSIEVKAEYEILFDKPFEDKNKIRVSGPFTVESLSPHRMLTVDESDNLIDSLKETSDQIESKQSFVQMVLENLKISGVQQAHKADKLSFSSVVPWPGRLICADGRYSEAGDGEGKRAAIFIGPEFGTVQRADLVEAAREAGEAGFDSLVTCAFNYEAHATDFTKLGRIPVLKARMNADLHMSEDLKNTGKGNLFVIFGEPDIELLDDGGENIRIKVNGVDVFKPQTGEVVSDGADGIACWFIDTDYNEESFFVRQAYFLGANDPYSSLKSSLKSEIHSEAWATLNSDTSRGFPKPKSGRIAVKVINHLGDEVMKVFKVK